MPAPAGQRYPSLNAAGCWQGTDMDVITALTPRSLFCPQETLHAACRACGGPSLQVTSGNLFECMVRKDTCFWGVGDLFVNIKLFIFVFA